MLPNKHSHQRIPRECSTSKEGMVRNLMTACLIFLLILLPSHAPQNSASAANDTPAAASLRVHNVETILAVTAPDQLMIDLTARINSLADLLEQAVDEPSAQRIIKTDQPAQADLR